MSVWQNFYFLVNASGRCKDVATITLIEPGSFESPKILDPSNFG
jgi:hypothetical protein